MSLSFAVLLFVGLLAFSWALNAGLLCLGGRLWKVEGVRFRKALLAVALITVFGVVLHVAEHFLARAIPQPFAGQPAEFDFPQKAKPLLTGEQIAALASFMGLIGGVWWLLARMFRAPAGRAALLGLTTLIPGTLANLGIAWGVRALVLEAFVNPFGSMAPTLIGDHADLSCDNCGQRFPVGMSAAIRKEVRGQRIQSPCPNCGSAADVPASVTVEPGDLILVDKLRRPERWDLFLFRNPLEPSAVYLKRLVGLPGERLEIAGGDLFLDGVRLRKEPEAAPDLWIRVHDSRQVPRRMVADGPQWRPYGADSEWHRFGDRWACPAAAEPQGLEFSGLSSQRSYNLRSRWDPAEPELPVSDVRLACHVGSLSGEGELSFRWYFGGLTVAASVKRSGEVRLVMTDEEHATPETGENDAPADRTVEGRLDTSVSGGTTLNFAVRDGRAWIAQEERVAAAMDVLPETIGEARAFQRRVHEPCRIALVARECSVELERLVLDRDVYYLSLDEMDVDPRDVPHGGDRITLGPGQHFGLGDNSQRSKDSRMFGPIDESEILGVARWIYWPPSRWREF